MLNWFKRFGITVGRMGSRRWKKYASIITPEIFYFLAAMLIESFAYSSPYASARILLFGITAGLFFAGFIYAVHAYATGDYRWKNPGRRAILYLALTAFALQDGLRYGGLIK
ncbi:MAG TPA: hypothetical protein VGG19_02325 [Tepidisphaeraceae bacterium]|jgi:hypothetical protein